MKLLFTLFVFSIFVIILADLACAQTYLIENNTWQANLKNLRWSNLVLGDVDNDNDLDIILFGCLTDGANDCENGMEANVYINNGTSFEENLEWEQNLSAVSWGSIALGDIDNDGDLDMAVTGCGTSKYPPCDNLVGSKIYINNGTSFEENLEWEQNLSAVSWGSIALGDIDNDGDLDMAVTGIGIDDYLSIVYTNNGTTFTENQTWGQNIVPVGRSSIILVDVDNDGDLDLDLNGFDDTNEIGRIYTNNGTTFTENQTWGQNVYGWGFPEISFGDFDNDGKTDCVRSGAMAGDHLYVYKNTGTTLTINQTGIGDGGEYLVGFFEGSFSWGDIDNDGDLDLAAMGADGEGGRSRIYNNNQSVFIEYTSAQTDFKIGFREGGLSFGDFDNDGDLDLVVSGVDFETTDLLTNVYTNNATNLNQNPSPPSLNFTNIYDGQLLLSWNSGSDTETPTLGLYYNLRVGTCSDCHDVISGVYGGSSNPTAGYFGNMMQRRSITLNRYFDPGTTIYWSVQTIDTGLAKSAWSTEQVYVIPGNESGNESNCTPSWSCESWGACQPSNTQTCSSWADANECNETYDGSNTRSCTYDDGSNNGGSTGSSSSYTPPKVEHTFSEIRAGEPAIKMLADGLSVTIRVREAIANVDMEATMTTERPAPVTKEAKGNVYRYIEINSSGLNDSDIEEATMEFNVSVGWINGSNIDLGTVTLHRYHSDEWQALETNLLSSDKSQYYYSSETPGFSYFVITGEVLETGGDNETTTPTLLCTPGSWRCSGNELQECSVMGTVWLTKELCEGGCDSESLACASLPMMESAYLAIVLPVAVFAVVAIAYRLISRSRKKNENEAIGQ